MITVEEALARCFALVTPLPAEPVGLRQAAGRVLAEAVSARLTQPPFDASAMDGYALGRLGSAGDRFDVVGEAGAGHAFTGTLAPDQAARIFTGAPLPQGAATIIIQDEVDVDGAAITLKVDPRPGDHTRSPRNSASARCLDTRSASPSSGSSLIASRPAT